jgi:hypothetical protein
MPVTNNKKDDHHHWIPSITPLYGKITITDKNGTEYTVMDTYTKADEDNNTLSASFTKNLNERLGRFDLSLSNDYGRYLDKFEGGELVKFYAGYGELVSNNDDTLLYTGLIDDIKYGVNMTNGYYLNINGRELPVLADTSVSVSFISAKADYCISKVFFEHYPEVKLQFWNGTEWAEATYNQSTDSVDWDKDVSNFSESLVNIQAQHKKTINLLGEIVSSCNLDGYLEYLEDETRWVYRIFNKETIDSNVAISFGTNLIQLNEYGDNKSELFNDIKVYSGRGASGDTILILKTEEDLASQAQFWRKEKIINKNDLETMEAVEERAKLELAKGIQTTYTSRIKITMSPFVKPGYLIDVFLPYCGMEGKYKIVNFTQRFGHPFTTDLEFSRDSIKIPDLFVGKINPEEILSNVNNPNNMKNSYVLLFNEVPSKITMNNCDVVVRDNERQIQLSPGETEGWFETNTLVTDSPVTYCELRKRENDFTSLDTYEVSNTNGIMWDELTAQEIGDIHEFDIPDNRLKFRVTLRRNSEFDTSPSYRGFALMYK